MKTLLSLLVLFIFTFTTTTPVVAEEKNFRLEQPLLSTEAHSSAENEVVVSVIKYKSVTLSRRWSAYSHTHLDFIAEIDEYGTVLIKSGSHIIRVTVLEVHLNRGWVRLRIETDPYLDE